MSRIDRKLELTEELLRERSGSELSAGFKRGVMDAISRLPEPQLRAALPGQPGWRQWLAALSSGERFGLALVLLALLLPLLPGASEWLVTLDFSLQTAELSLVLGSTVLSASLFSVLVAALFGGLLILCGAMNYHNRLLDA